MISVPTDGLITSVGPGDATVTVINGPAESIIQVHVQAAQVGPIALGTAGGVVAGSDGSLVQVAPGALAAPSSVSITPISQANLPIAVPSWLNFAGAVNLQVGSGQLATPVQLAIPMPGVPAGTTIFIYAAGSLPDDQGIEQPIWLQVDDGVVGSDALLHAHQFEPYEDLERTQILLFSIGVEAIGLGLIAIFSGFQPLLRLEASETGLEIVFEAGAVAMEMTSQLIRGINLPVGTNNYKAFVILKSALLAPTTGQVTIAAGVNLLNVAVGLSPRTIRTPSLTSGTCISTTARPSW